MLKDPRALEEALLAPEFRPKLGDWGGGHGEAGYENQGGQADLERLNGIGLSGQPREEKMERQSSVEIKTRRDLEMVMSWVGWFDSKMGT